MNKKIIFATILVSIFLITACAPSSQEKKEFAGEERIEEPAERELVEEDRSENNTNIMPIDNVQMPQEVLPLPEEKPHKEKPVLKNLGIAIEPWNKKTNMAGDFLFEDKNYVDDKIFTEFGHKIVNSMGEKLLPEIGFNVPVGTKVVSPIDGVITDVTLYEPSQDYIIFMKTDESSQWIVGFEHVYHMRLKAGDKVLAGQELAEVSPSYGKTAFGNVEINVWVGGKNIIKYCPFEFLDESSKQVYEVKINQLAKDWETFIGKDVYQQENWVAPGCLLHNLTER